MTGPPTPFFALLASLALFALFLLFAIVAPSCASCGAPAGVVDGGPHGPGLDNDGGSPADGGAEVPDAGDDAPCSPPAIPGGALEPEPGALYYEQLGLDGFGEAAIAVGPDGTILLVDVANDSHDDDIVAALDEITAALGAPPRIVDHALITHYHADHADGLAQLLGSVALRGRVIFRGFVDVDTANADVVQRVCEALAAQPGLAEPVCDGAERAPCDPSTWTGAYRRGGCPGLGSLALGADASLAVIAASGEIAGHSFEEEVGPLRLDDSNGENARSLVAVLSHGPFRLLVQGDLTGGGSDTDAVEPFIATHIGDASDVGVLGVDVMHAGHHGRDTSSSAAWLDRLLPSDGLARNVVIGVSTLHLGSPHAPVIDAVVGRLAEGRAWTTLVAAGGASDARLVDAAGGKVIVKTVDGGRAYFVQAIDGDGAVIETRAFASVGCRE